MKRRLPATLGGLALVFVAALVGMLTWHGTVLAPETDPDSSPSASLPNQPESKVAAQAELQEQRQGSSARTVEAARVNEPEGTKAEDASATVTPRLAFRLIDDRTGAPLANAKVRFATLVSYDNAIDFERIPRRDELFGANEYTTSPAGIVDAIEQPDNAEDLDASFDIYPLPWDWIPVSPPTIVWQAFRLRVGAPNPDPVEIRVKPGAVLSVTCVHPDGTPVPGVRVFALPQIWKNPIGALYGDDRLDGSDIERARGLPLPPKEQSGTGTPELVHFEFVPDTTNEPEHQWTAKTGVDGTAEISGLPPAAYFVGALGPGMPRMIEELVVDGDRRATITLPSPADVALTIRWLGADPPSGRDPQDIKLLGGNLAVVPYGKAEVQIKLHGIAPGLYEVAPVQPGARGRGAGFSGDWPEQWIELHPGTNQATISIGKEAWGQWDAQLTANDSRIEKFDLLAEPGNYGLQAFTISNNRVGLREKWFRDGSPVRMPPGTYTVHLPGGRKQQVKVEPGRLARTSIQVDVREVTFTIGEEFDSFLLDPGEADEPRIALASAWHGLQATADDLLAGALSEHVGSRLDGLRPGRAVTCSLPPAVYGIVLRTSEGRLSTIIDLLDSNLTSVHLDMNGWPGASVYQIKTAAREDSLQSFFWCNDARFAGSFHNGCVLTKDGTSKVWFPSGGVKGWVHAFSESKQEHASRSAWILEPGDHEVLPEHISGDFKVSFTGVGGQQWIDAVLRWRRGGIEYSDAVNMEYEQIIHPDGTNSVRVLEGEQRLEIENLPAGRYTAVLRRGDAKDPRSPKYDCAVLEFDLSGDHILDITRLKWQPCGQILVRKLRGSDAFAADAGIGLALEYHGRQVTFGETEEYLSEPLPVGEQRVLLHNVGPLPALRTVKIAPGNTTTIDLRELQD